MREIPLVAQLGALLCEHKRTTRFAKPGDYVFVTSNVTPLGIATSRDARLAARRAAGFNAEGAPRLRFHDLRHTFASHLIVDLGLDVAQVSRILGHASVTTTLDIYTHLFDDPRHAAEIRARMAASPFGRLLEPTTANPDNVIVFARPGRAQMAPRRPVGLLD